MIAYSIFDNYKDLDFAINSYIYSAAELLNLAFYRMYKHF
jgi:hypothetical protein